MESDETKTAVAAILDGFPGQWSVGQLMTAVHPTLARVHTVWREATRRRDLPPADAIAPRPLKFALPDMHVYTISPEPPRYRVRLIGTRFEDYTGRGLVGRAVDEIAHPVLRLALSRILAAVETGRAPLHIKAPKAIALPNGDHKALESLWLPCAADGERIDRAIAVSLLTPETAA